MRFRYYARCKRATRNIRIANADGRTFLHFPRLIAGLPKTGEVLTNCQTVYSLHENRVFPSETDFGWKYAIFIDQNQHISLILKIMQKHKSRKKADSTSQHSCSDKPSDKQKKTKLVRIIVRLLSDWRRTSVGLRTDSCPYRRRTAVGLRTDSCRTTGKHSSSPPISPFSGFY